MVRVLVKVDVNVAAIARWLVLGFIVALNMPA